MRTLGHRSARVASALTPAALVAALVVACSVDRTPTPTHDQLGTRADELSQSPTAFTGSSLANKQLALTFDDGPGDRAGELSTYLKNQNIRAAFFVNGAHIKTTALPNPNGITVTAGVAAMLDQIVADGHLVANHTTTHRNLTSEVPTGQLAAELTETDGDIAAYAPPNRLLFRPPYGGWNTSVWNTLKVTAMNKYTGPVYWDIGDSNTEYPNKAADWACWGGSLQNAGGGLVNGTGYATTKQCGDAYITEIDAVGKGIVLMHDPYFWANGSTVDMVKYMVPLLKAKGYTFVRVDDVPQIAAALPCDASCATCSGPNPNQCTSCSGGKYLSGGTCNTCSTCGAGKYVQTACTATANTVCGNCNASCATCTGPAANQCTSCGGGKFLAGGACTTCSTCKPKEYLITACAPTADTVCGACDATCGTCSGPGAAECTSCNAGRYFDGASCLACSVCGAGTYEAAACTTTANTVCSPCDPSCTNCNGPAPTDCAACPPNNFLSGGKCNACTVCAAGKYRTAACTTTVDATCAACAPGTFSAAAGATSCSPCAAGTFASAAGATECKACGSCDDGDSCTADACDAAKGCTHTPIPGCTPKVDGGASSSSSGSSGSSGSSSGGSSSGGSSGGSSSSGGDAGATPPPGEVDEGGGCSAAGRAPSPGGVGLAIGVGLALAAVRRRRRD